MSRIPLRRCTAKNETNQQMYNNSVFRCTVLFCKVMTGSLDTDFGYKFLPRHSLPHDLPFNIFFLCKKRTAGLYSDFSWYWGQFSVLFSLVIRLFDFCKAFHLIILFFSWPLTMTATLRPHPSVLIVIIIITKSVWAVTVCQVQVLLYVLSVG